MADLTDVQNALVAEIAQALYPNGTGQASAVNAQCSIYAGWPTPALLDADLAAGKCHVSVFAPPLSKAVPQMMAQWQTVSITATQLSATISGMVATLSGTVTTPQAVSAHQGNVQVSYAVQTGDTLASICTGLAALITGATSSGNTITFPQGADPEILFAEPATVLKEVGRQKQVYQVTVWAPTPTLRASIASLIDPVIRLGYRLTMPDTTAAEIRFAGSADEDKFQKQNLYVRHLRYEAEYATTVTGSTTTVTAPVVNVSETLGTL